MSSRLSVEKLIGRGAFADVYRAVEGTPPRPFALKVLRESAPEILSAFLQEARFLTQLSHHGLIPLYGFSPDSRDIDGGPEDIRGRPSYWMELVEGRPLLDAAAGRSAEKIVDWLREVLEAIDYIHGQGIVHGDIKPSNLLIDSHDRARLLDFGLSQLQVHSPTSKKFRGTLLYASPEAVSGGRLSAGDIYSLGLVVHEALTGRHPHAEARSFHEFFCDPSRRLGESNIPLPRPIKRALDRMIATDPADRLMTAAETLSALRDFSHSTPKREAAISLHSLRLFGREDSMRRAIDFLSLRREKNENALLLVHGPAGVGKSRFSRELAFELALQGWKVDRRSNAEPLAAAEISLIHRRLMSPSSEPTVTIWEFAEERTEIVRDRRVLDIPLKPLSPRDTSDFVRSILRREVSEEVLNEIHLRTGGLPDLVVRLLRQLALKGGLEKRGIQLAGIRTSLPEDYQNIFRQRLQALGERDLRILSYVVLSRRPVSAGEVSVSSALPYPKVSAVLEQLADSGLIESSNDGPGRLRAGHPDLSTLVLEFLKAETTKSIHESWITHWRSQKEILPDAVIDLAFHALALTTHPETAAWVLQAGEILRGRGVKAEKAMIPAYEACLRRHAGLEDRGALLRALANAYGRMGDFQKSLEGMEEWFSEFGRDRGLPAMKYWLASAVACKNLGDLRESKRRLLQGVASGNPGDPAECPRLARIHSLLGLMAAEERDFEKAVRHLEEAHRLVPAGSTQEAEVFKHQAVLAFEEGRRDESRDLLLRSQEIYESCGDLRGRIETEIERGNLAVRAGDVEVAETAYVMAIRIASDTGHEVLLARACQNRGVLLCRAGRLAAALEELEKARELYVFFGDPPDKAQNLLQLALVHAWLGGFASADSFLREARDLGEDPSVKTSPEFEPRLREAVFETETIRRGEAPQTIANPFRFDRPPAPWDVEHRWLQAMIAGPDSESLRSCLTEIHQNLPPHLRPSFEERSDFQQFVPTATPVVASGEEPMNALILNRLQTITSHLLNAGDFSQTLERILDAALELSRAQRGFLLLPDNTPDSPVPGFRIAAVRNVARNALEREDLRVSLSAVNEAFRTKRPVVADNALEDERFRKASSVVDLDLKSILVLPLVADDHAVGVLYLDHDFETKVFGANVQELLGLFAAQATLALQKARLIDDLRRANAQLSETVSDQSAEIVALHKEVETQRLQLTHEYAEIIGQSPKMMETLQLVDRLIDTSIPVWVYGESGTGKEAIARALHFKGPRAKKPFVSENCSSLAESLLESELFGHRKGAFTHADRDKKGLLEFANGGTVFLDEVADMSPALQAKLLRFLQEGEVRPLGSNETIRVDVRVVSASNRDLGQLVREETFREDLFYRLNGMMVSLPPLRERIEDIPLLVQHFLKTQATRENRPPLEITRSALEILTNYEWPGNVRELENTIRSASLFHVHGKLLPKAFHFKKALSQRSPAAIISTRATTLSLRKGVHDPAFDERSAILKALRENRCHKGMAADTLGISRRYLYTKLSQHGIPLKPAALRRFVEKELKASRPTPPK